MMGAGTECGCGLGRHAAVYRDEHQEPGRRRQALAALIAAYSSGRGGSAQAEEAGRLLAEVLAPIIRRAARQVAHGASRQERSDFVEDALMLILAPRPDSAPRICSYRPEDGWPPECWLRKVLRNCWVSRQRRRDRQSHPRGDLAAVVVDIGPDAPDWWDLQAALATPFSGPELDELGVLDVCLRVEVLCLGGLWLKVPASVWEGWLTEYERERDVALVRPFPPDDFIHHDAPRERLRPLAECLGRRTNTLAVRWMRNKDRLEGLTFVRNLRLM